MSNKVKTILIVTALIVVGLAAAVTSIFLFTDVPKIVADMFDNDFRVMYGADKYTGTDNSVTLPNASRVEFRVKGCKSFSYEIIPNADFEYAVDGKAYAYGESDIGSVFYAECSVENGGIIFDCNNDNSVGGVLLRLHSGTDILLPATDTEYPYMFVARSDDKEIRIAFGFTPKSLEDSISELSITPGVVYF